MKTPEAIWIDPINRGSVWVKQSEAQPSTGDVKYILADIDSAIENVADFLSEFGGDTMSYSYYTKRAKTLLRDLGYV